MTARTSLEIPHSRDPHGSKRGDSRMTAQERGAEWPYLPGAIAFLTGAIDIVGFLTLGHFTSANITVDLAGVSSGLAPGHHVHPINLLAIPVFFVGVVSVYFLARRFGIGSTTVVRSVLFAQFLLLAFVYAFIGMEKHALVPNTAPVVIAGATIVLVIGLSNTCMHLLDSQAATTWAMTANSVIATDALMNIATKNGSDEERASDWQKWHAIWPVILCFMGGVFAGTTAVFYLHQGAWLAPAAISLLILLLAKKKTLSPQQIRQLQPKK